MTFDVRALARPGALFVIAGCFLLSGALRIASFGPALAEEITAMTATPATMDVPAQDMAAAQCPPPLEPEALLSAIRTREAQLTSREDRLNDREQVLRVSALKIEDQLAELVAAEERLAATLALADAAAEQDIDRLTSVYENMKPKSAAAIFETMDVNFAAGFLMRMRPDAAAEVLSNLSSDAAYSISVVMAGRNVGVPTQ